MLSDQDHGVRMHLAKTIVVLLQSGQDGEGSLLPSGEQDKLMDEVLKSLQAPNNDVQVTRHLHVCVLCICECKSVSIHVDGPR